MKIGNDDLAYYEKRFQVYHKIVEKLEDKRKKESEAGELELLDSAVFTIMKNGIENSLDEIRELKDEGAKCWRYENLIAEINTVLQLQMNETLILDQTANEKCLSVYREYLQGIENVFQSYIKRKSAEHGNVFSLAFDLTKGETMMCTLFQGEDTLCAVFLPSDDNVKEIYSYLPMLTHEVSHNFKFSETNDRNAFVLTYMLECFSRDMLRALFHCVPEAMYNIFWDQDIEPLVQEIAKVIREELLKEHPEFLKQGHLDEFPSVIWSLFTDTSSMISEIEGTYAKECHPWDILKKSFQELFEFSRHYLQIKDSELPEEQMKKLKKYLDDKNETNGISASDVKRLIEEMILLIIQKTGEQTKEYSENVFQGEQWEEFVCSLVGNVKSFSETMEKMGKRVNKEYENHLDAFYEIANQLIGVKVNMENIFYICRLYQEIPAKHYENSLGKKIYYVLQKKIVSLLEQETYNSSKIYFSSPQIHAVLLKMGLLDGEKESRTFLTYYNQIFKQWDEKWVLKLLEENLSVYREIFADLGMCAIFGFSALGYLRFMEQHNSFGRQKISRESNIDRIETVLRVLHAVNESTEKESGLAKKYLSALNYKRYEQTRLESGRYDERYKQVYADKIIGSQWVERLHKNPVIMEIGTYYNQKDKSDMDQEGVWKIFCNEYTRKYQKRKERYKENSCNPIACMLEGDTDEDDWT